MSYMCITQRATIEVPTHKDLLAADKRYPGAVIGQFVVTKPLTASQLRRLPKGLSSRLKHGRAEGDA